MNPYRPQAQRPTRVKSGYVRTFSTIVVEMFVSGLGPDAGLFPPHS